ncbi:YjcZ family sporulation protein [Paenibacillus terrigena]|nr:YjcZ family sporulation protein [Paenibacillus terrigena]
MGCGGLGTTTGVILVLFILLVIVLRAMRHHI